jgi:hypothetical protein
MKTLLLLIMALSSAVSFADSKAQKKMLYAGPDQTIAAGVPAQLSGTAIGIKKFYWSTSGTGTFSNSNSLTTLYYPSDADVEKGNVTLTLSDGKKNPKESDSMKLVFVSCGTVDAGADLVTCGFPGGSLSLVATATNYTSIAWSTNGYGNFDDATSLTPVYYYHQGDINLETIELYAMIQSASCNAIADTVRITFQAAPQLEFPEPYVQEYDYAGVTASVNMYGSAASGIWTTSGSGSFSEPNATVTAYYPSDHDRIDGCVQLIFTTDDPEGICGPATGSMTACFNPIVVCPDLSIGGDQTVCASYGGGEAIYLQAYVNGSADGLYWSSNGAGFFDDPYSLNPVYYTDPSDVNNAQIQIYATISQNNCYTSASITVFLNSAPELVFPEPYVYTCAGTPVNVNVYLYGYASSGFWMSSGYGTFQDANSTYTTYTPGENETGTVTFTFITNDPDGPCGSTAGSMEAYFEDCSFTSAVNTDDDELVSLYPNPSSDQVELKTNLKIKKSEVYITDITGNRVDFGWNGDAINISGLLKGAHILHVITEDNKNYRIRFMKL